MFRGSQLPHIDGSSKGSTWNLPPYDWVVNLDRNCDTAPRNSDTTGDVRNYLMDRKMYGKKRFFDLLVAIGFAFWILGITLSAQAAPYAAIVVDARTGEVLHSRNADTRLHPAALSKMMTLYVAFSAIEAGEISLDSEVVISRHAASEPPSKLGLNVGQSISLRFLIRAAAVKSANDAATAIAESISGSEEAFAARMNLMARRMGMTRTTFRNAHGLTESGHLSTARDMAILARHVLYDFPQYYNLFSRQSTSAGEVVVRNTNRRLLSGYRGADGIKTGYTRAAGFNLAASAERGGERVIAVVFGGTSTASRNARVAELLDLGFRRAPTRVALVRPELLPADDDAVILPPDTSTLDPGSTTDIGPDPGSVAVAQSGIPVIRALDAPFRHSPDEPGGQAYGGQKEWADMHQEFVADDTATLTLARVGPFESRDVAARVAIAVSLNSSFTKYANSLRIIELDRGLRFAFEVFFPNDAEREAFCGFMLQVSLNCVFDL